ncbi:uncharacterized protein LOC143342432 [Colletes latitarsis]|uniref:uncharacterized protein LOC143342432 n=1 Tax=Colletes latitarsis TaxID=2605962 RepID=UPI0040360F85
MKLSQTSIEAGLTSTNACRLCLRSEDCVTSIFTEEEESQRLRSHILDCCPITLSEDTRLPQAICTECKHQVAVTYQFREQCRKSEQRLRSLYGSNYWNEFYRPNTPNYKIVRDYGVQTNWSGLAVDLTKDGGQKKNNDRKASRGKKVAVCLSRVGRIERRRKNDKAPLAKNRSSKKKVETKFETVRKGINKKNETQLETIGKEDGVEKTMQNSGEQRNEKVQEVGLKGVEERNDGDDNHDHDSENRTKPTDDKTGKPYMCDVCSKTFASKSGLRLHFKSHIGAKPYVCRHCNKAFVLPSYAKRHERTHLGDKRFMCHLCSAGFASSNGLKYHLNLHTGEAKYRCETCGKAFYRSKFLKEHIFTHTGEKPFACRTCGFTYKNSGSLFAHEKKCKAKFQVSNEREPTVKKELNGSADFGG